MVNHLLVEIPVNEIPCVDGIPPQFLCEGFAAFFALTSPKGAAMAEKVKNRFW